MYSQVFIENINKKLSKFIYFVLFLFQPIRLVSVAMVTNIRYKIESNAFKIIRYHFCCTLSLSVLYFFCLFFTYCLTVSSHSMLIPVDTSTHSSEMITLQLHADLRFAAKCAMQVTIVRNCMKKSTDTG